SLNTRTFSRSRSSATVSAWPRLFPLPLSLGLSARTGMTLARVKITTSPPRMRLLSMEDLLGRIVAENRRRQRQGRLGAQHIYPLALAARATGSTSSAARPAIVWSAEDMTRTRGPIGAL